MAASPESRPLTAEVSKSKTYHVSAGFDSLDTAIKMVSVPD